MKKIITLLFVSMTLFSFGQVPVVQGTYLPVRGTSIKQIYDITQNDLAVPSGGINQTWNYSVFPNITDTFTLATFDPANTGAYKDSFPDATHASFLRAPFAEGDSTYFYFKIDTTGVHGLGGYVLKGGINASMIANPTELMIPATVTYPMTVLDSSRVVGFFDYTYNSTLYHVKRVSTQHKNMATVGYGSITTPVGSFNDVLLAKETMHIVDTFYVDLLGNGNYQYFGYSFQLTINDYNRYSFFRNNTFGSTVLLLMLTDTNSINPTEYWAWYTLPVDFGYISGTVRDSSGSFVTSGVARLYREHSNFSKDDILATSPIDGYGNYRFDSIPYGEYRISAKPDSVLYPNALTTYHGDSTNWLTANTIMTSGDTNGIDITLQYHSPQNNTVTLNGTLNLNLGVHKMMTNNPVPGIDIIVRKKPAGIVASEHSSDSYGNFAFDHLDNGDYNLFVDIPGLHMAGTYDFTISGNTLLNNLDFTVGMDSIHPTSVTGIKNIDNKNGLLNIYPNPFSSSITINISLTEKSDMILEVYNMLGEKVKMLDAGIKQSGNYYYNFSSENLYLSGLYIVKLNVNDKIYTYKVVKE